MFHISEISPIADSCTFSCYDGAKRIPEQKEKDIYHKIKKKKQDLNKAAVKAPTSSWRLKFFTF